MEYRPSIQYANISCLLEYSQKSLMRSSRPRFEPTGLHLFCRPADHRLAGFGWVHPLKHLTLGPMPTCF